MRACRGGGGMREGGGGGARTWMASEKSFSADIVARVYTGPSNLITSSPAGMGAVANTPRPLISTSRSSKPQRAHSCAFVTLNLSPPGTS
jgi:hypothetical protein